MKPPRREFPLAPPPVKGSEIDIESFWGTSVGERQDVDLDDGPATMFKVPSPPQLVIQEAAEKLAYTIQTSCSNLEESVRTLNTTLRRMGIAFLVSAAITTALILIF